MENAAMVSFYSILWYFILYSFFGWCLEVVFCSVNTGAFVNRGFLNGPLCPIYGFGGVIIVSTLDGVRENLLLLFVASALLCSLLELIAGFLLKKIFHTSWWDYSDQPFTLGGYICLKFSLLWGVACIFLVRLIHPPMQGLVKNMPQALGWVLLAVFYSILLADLVLTVLAIAKLNRDLSELTRLSEGLRRPSTALAKKLGDSAISVVVKIDDKLQEIESGVGIPTARQAAEGLTPGQEMKARIDELLAHRAFVRERLMAAFPRMKSARYQDALERLRHSRRHDLNKLQL